MKVLLLAHEMGVLKIGTVALDGTKIHANASRHSALSHEHARKIEAQLKAARWPNCWRKPKWRTRRTFPTACRSRRLARREDGLAQACPREVEARAGTLRAGSGRRTKLAAREAKVAATASRRGRHSRLGFEDRCPRIGST